MCKGRGSCWRIVHPLEPTTSRDQSGRKQWQSTLVCTMQVCGSVSAESSKLTCPRVVRKPTMWPRCLSFLEDWGFAALCEQVFQLTGRVGQIACPCFFESVIRRLQSSSPPLWKATQTPRTSEKQPPQPEVSMGSWDSNHHRGLQWQQAPDPRHENRKIMSPGVSGRDGSTRRLHESKTFP